MTFFYYLFLFSVLNFLNINTGYFFNKSKNSEYGEIFKNIIIGFCFIIIFTSFFYLVFNVGIQSILILLLLTNIFFLTQNLNKFLFFIKLLSKSLIPSLFFIIFFSLISFFYGEQYYSFRGNHWDYFNYITSALAISEYNLSYIETSIEELNNLYPFKGMGWLIHIEIRPSINIFYSLFFKIGLNNFYLVCFVLKTYGLFLIFSSSYIFLEKFPLKNFPVSVILFFSYIFSLCFWSLYIFEIDSLSQLFAQSLMLFCILFILENKNKLILKKNYKSKLIFLISNLAFFLIYPELYAIYFLVSFTYLIISKQLFEILKKNFKEFFFLLTILLLISLPFFNYTHKFLYHQIFAGFENPDFWGYYGAFLLGKENPVLNQEFIKVLKNSISQDLGVLNYLNLIFNQILIEKYNLFFVNILPSVSGLFHFTIGKYINWINLIHLIFLIIINFYLIKVLIKNCFNIFKYKSEISDFLKSVILVFLILGSFLIIKESYWSFIKLYFYLSFFWFFIFTFKIDKNKLFIINYSYILLLSLFPLYFFINVSNGIGKNNSFPSIIKREMKENFYWKIPFNEIKKCNTIFIDILDHQQKKYITNYLFYINKKYTVIKKDKILLKNNTCLLRSKSRFEILSNYK